MTQAQPVSHIGSDTGPSVALPEAAPPVAHPRPATPAAAAHTAAPVLREAVATSVTPLRTPSAAQSQATSGSVHMTAKIDPRQEGITSTLDEECVVHGNISSKRGIYLLGKVHGNVRVEGDEAGAGTVIVGSTAEVHGVVAANRVIIQGKVLGGVMARGMLDMADTAVLRGHGLYNMMRQAEGAEIEGTFRKIKSADDGSVDRLIELVESDRK